MGEGRGMGLKAAASLWFGRVVLLLSFLAVSLGALMRGKMVVLAAGGMLTLPVGMNFAWPIPPVEAVGHTE